jgi:hypothetical protein
MLVRLPESINFFKEFDSKLEGDGRIWGFILAKEGQRPGVGPTVVAEQIGQCLHKACDARSGGFEYGEQGFGFRKQLPAGNYRLWLIADDAPVTLTLRFSSLHGSVEAMPTESVASEIRRLPFSISSSEAGTIYSAGAFTDIQSPTYSLMGLWAKGDRHVASVFGDCSYRSPSDAPPTAAFVPGCPTGEGEPFVSTSETPGGAPGGVIFTSSSFDGAAGIGGWFSSTAGVSDFGAIGFWMKW